MNQKWPTRDQDLKEANKIMRHYDELEDGIYLVEIAIGKDSEIEVNPPQWLVDMAWHFDATYGRKKGDVVTRRVLTRFLVGDETIH